MKIELTEIEIDLLKSGLASRKKRANDRIKNEVKRGINEFITIHEKRIKEIDLLYLKLSEKNI